MGKADSLNIITDERALDTDNFSLCGDYSAIGIDRDLNRFYVTYDRILFRKLPEVIQTILEANGFVHNFENMLSCLERLRFGIRSEHRGDSVRRGSPCLVIRFPDKKKIGALLNNFYKEVNKYEDIIASYQADNISSNKKNRRELEVELKKLREENAELKKKNTDLIQMVAHLQSAHEHALTAGNSMPSDMAFARAKEIIAKDRCLVLRCRNKTHRVPLSMLDALPEKEQMCLAIFDKDNKISKVFVYGEGSKIIPKTVCIVLHIKGDRIKLRDRFSRRVYLFTVRSDKEREQLGQVVRGSSVIASLWKKQIFNLEMLMPAIDTLFEELMHERVIRAGIDLHISDDDEREEKAWKS